MGKERSGGRVTKSRDRVARRRIPPVLMSIGVVTGIAGLVGAALVLTGFLSRSDSSTSTTDTVVTTPLERRHAEQRLLASIPREVRRHCARRATQPVEGSVAGVQCTPPDFPTEYEGIDYDLFSDPAALDAAFVAETNNPGVRTACVGIRQRGGRYVSDAGVRGRVACVRGRRANEGFLWINWTQDDDLVLGQVFKYQQPFREIAAWWMKHIARDGRR
jgi:hypothetical protein